MIRSQAFSIRPRKGSYKSNTLKPSLQDQWAPSLQHLWTRQSPSIIHISRNLSTLGLEISDIIKQ